MVRDFSTWRPCAEPALTSVTGRFVRLEEFDPERHAQGLYDAIGGVQNDPLWRYIPLPPPDNAAMLAAMFTMMSTAAQHLWRVVIIIDVSTDEILGTASYMRVRPDHGSAEVGCVIFSQKMQKTPAATEAMYLMASYLFDDLGYRRYEWKCHNGNAASKRASERLGFTLEGVFRNDMIVKGESRDTAWYSIIDTEWPVLKGAFQAWLAPNNFDDAQMQKCALRAFRTS